MNASPIIDLDELLRIYKDSDIKIFDVSNGKNSKTNFELEHLESAHFVDLNSQLAEINNDVAIGGRHPLPNIKKFEKTLNDLGIAKTTHVIIYDDKNGSNAAARFWWMLKSAGHQKVQVLNGGFDYAKKNNFPLESGQGILTKSNETYKIEKWLLPTVTIEEVENAVLDKNCLVVDVRDKDRYYGVTEPIDLIAGHIPRAINVPFSENLDANGLFLKPNVLKAKYESIFQKINPKNIIIHCGSGVTACHTLLALDYAGFEIPNLYVGSWSEWSRNNKEIIKKSNP